MGKQTDNEMDDELMERDTMTLELEDGDKLECIVMDIFEVNEKNYIALLPMNAEGGVDDDADIYLYRYEELGDDEVRLDNIEDDDEFEMVSDRYDELRDEEDFAELFGDTE